jgi:hypothetical protein
MLWPNFVKSALVLSLWMTPACGSAPKAPMIEDCLIGADSQLIACDSSDGAQLTRNWKDIHGYVCHPAKDEAAYINYCAGK